MKQEVFVVFGASDEYSDHVEWPVVAFLDKKKAQRKVKECTAWYKAAQQEAITIDKDNKDGLPWNWWSKKLKTDPNYIWTKETALYWPGGDVNYYYLTVMLEK